MLPGAVGDRSGRITVGVNRLRRLHSFAIQFGDARCPAGVSLGRMITRTSRFIDDFMERDPPVLLEGANEVDVGARTWPTGMESEVLSTPHGK
jgi:hypothetical protein